jgi:hypothetical protein
MSMHRWLSALGLAVALAGCGSATDATSFTAPPGYTSAVSIGPFAQVWRGPKHGGIVLTALPTQIDFNKITESSDVKDAQILKDQPVKICGNQDAHYLSMIGESETAQSQTSSPGTEEAKQRIDLIATHLNGKTYMAMYIRPQGTAEDPAAEAAIHDICAK